jgi:hypothetical protein
MLPQNSTAVLCLLCCCCVCCLQVFTITVPAEQEASARDLVAAMSPNARLTYSVGGTLKFELPTSEVRHTATALWLVSCCKCFGCCSRCLGTPLLLVCQLQQ